MGAGNDRLVMGDFTNSLTVANLETLVGGTDVDIVVLSSAATAGMTINLGGGNDSLTLDGSGGTVSLTGVGTVTGGAAADRVVYVGAASGEIDLDAGIDTVVLGARAAT